MSASSSEYTQHRAERRRAQSIASCLGPSNSSSSLDSARHTACHEPSCIFMTTVESMPATLARPRPARNSAHQRSEKPVHRNDTGRCDWSLNITNVGGQPSRYRITVSPVFAALIPSQRAGGASIAARTNHVTI